MPSQLSRFACAFNKRCQGYRRRAHTASHNLPAGANDTFEASISKASAVKTNGSATGLTFLGKTATGIWRGVGAYGRNAAGSKAVALSSLDW